MQRFVSMLIAAGIVVAGILGLAVPAQAAFASGTYQLRNLQYNQCMDLAYGNPANGTPIGRVPYCDGAVSRRWTFESTGDKFLCNYKDWLGNCQGYDVKATYRIKNALTGKCVDINDGGTDSGETIHEWDCYGALSQLWYLIEEPDTGRYYISSALVFDEVQINRVIDSGPTYPLRIWTLNRSGAQQWIFE